MALSPDAGIAETEAALWLARLHADDRSLRDDRAFLAWLAADAANRQAFDHLTAVWDVTGGVERRPYAPSGPLAAPTRRRVLLGVGAVAIAGGGFAGWSAAVAGIYETRLGEQRHVTLDDGSLLFLDTDTKVRARLAGTERRVTLYHGRCNFRIAPDGARPFVVAAGERRVVTPRATFDVRRDGDAVAVTCLSGAATVAAGTDTNRLLAGERLTTAPGAAAKTAPVDPAAATAWQLGQIVFDDDPLTEVVVEMNRYSPSRLVVGSADVGALRLSGSYRVGDNLTFAQSLTHLLPLKVQRSGNDIGLAALR